MEPKSLNVVSAPIVDSVLQSPRDLCSSPAEMVAMLVAGKWTGGSGSRLFLHSNCSCSNTGGLRST